MVSQSLSAMQLVAVRDEFLNPVVVEHISPTDKV